MKGHVFIDTVNNDSNGMPFLWDYIQICEGVENPTALINRTAKGVPVLMVSKQAASRIGAWISKGYRPKDAQVRFIVYWQKEDSEDEIKIVLPEVHLRRQEI